jgi:hypothetical protein
LFFFQKIACSKYFELTHPGTQNVVIQHPNQYFEESEKFYEGPKDVNNNSGNPNNRDLNPPNNEGDEGNNKNPEEEDQVANKMEV